MRNQTQSGKQSQVITHCLGMVTEMDKAEALDPSHFTAKSAINIKEQGNIKGKTFWASGNIVLQQQAHADISLQKSPACSQRLTPRPGAPVLSLSPAMFPSRATCSSLGQTTFAPASSSHRACSTRDKKQSLATWCNLPQISGMMLYLYVLCKMSCFVENSY